MANFSETPLMEITLRRYENPHGLNQRDTLKKICLSLGLLQPGDSRDVIVDILLVLEKAKILKKELNSNEIKNELIEIRKNNGLSLNGTADSNIRRQLKRLRDVFLVEKVKNNYRILEFMDLNSIFENNIKNIILQAILSRNKDYFNYYNNNFENSKNDNNLMNNNDNDSNNHNDNGNDKIANNEDNEYNNEVENKNGNN